MQAKPIDRELMDQKDKDWLESDLSHFSEIEPYDWGDVDPASLGKPIYYEPGLGFVVEGGKDLEQ
jgi:hypothetical protein